MNFLEINEKKAFFVTETAKIKPEDLTRDQLFTILNNSFENYDNFIFPKEEEIETIMNPIEKIIVEQITLKIKEFHKNIPHINTEIKNQFPELSFLVQNDEK